MRACVDLLGIVTIMNIKLVKYLTVLPMISLLVACAQLGQLEAQDTDNGKITQNARTYNDHNDLADYQDKLAKEMLEKIADKKEFLEEYEDRSHYYGRIGQDFKSHTQANTRHFEQAATDAAQQANFHRKIAAELLQRDYAGSAEISEQAGNHKIKARLNSISNNLN